MHPHRPSGRGRAALALLALPALTSCPAQVFGVEHFNAVEVRSPHSHEFETVDAIAGFTPSFHLAGSAPVAAWADVLDERVGVRVERRNRGAYLLGIVLPVVPLFGAFDDPSDWEIVLLVALPESLEVDAARSCVVFEGEESQSAPRGFPVRSLGEVVQWIERGPTTALLAHADYSTGDAFELHLFLRDEGGRTDVLRTRFETRSGVHLDLRIWGEFPPRLSWVRRREADTRWDWPPPGQR
ncbi:MAG: hypothetical protein AAFP22_08625 [Planctomycetota bacterium]